MSKLLDLLDKLNKAKADIEEAERMLLNLDKNSETSFGLKKDSPIIITMKEALKNFVKQREASALNEDVSKMDKPVKTEPLKEEPPVLKTNTPKSIKNVEYSKEEKINFAMNNRDLGGKIVIVNEGELTGSVGEVVALDIPHLVIKLEDSSIIKIKPEQVVLG